jgi:hypothetical protein
LQQLDGERNFYTVEEMEQAREYKKGLVARDQSNQLIESARRMVS